MQKWQQIKVTTARDKVEFSDLSKFIIETQLKDIRNYNVETEAAVNKGSTSKTSFIGRGDDDTDNDVDGAYALKTMAQ